MVTLHLLKLLEDEGFGTINTDLFWEDAPLNSAGVPKDGVWIVTRGSEVSRVDAGIQAFDIYARYANKVTCAQKLEDILVYLRNAYQEVCELPTVPPQSDTQYINVSIQPTSGVENVGTDDQEKIVKVISGEVRYSIGE